MKKLLAISLSLSVIALVLCGLLIYRSGFLGERTMNPNWSVSAVQAYAEEKSLASSSTFFAVQNYFNATSTVDFFSFNQTGVSTSSYFSNCGTSTSRYGTPSDTLIDNMFVPTSTLSTGLAGTSTMAGFNAGTNSQNKIVLGATEWIVCKATTYVPATDDNAFTNVSSTFRGTAKYRLIK